MIDKNISVWRGNLTPPTQYHLWLKEDKLYHYNGEEWVENQIDQATSKNDGLMSKEDKNRLDNLVYDNLDSEDSSKALSANQGRILLKKIRDLNISAYKVKGSVDNITDVFSFDSEIGDVYNIINSFELEGKEYPAGTNVVWTGDRWDPLGGTIDLNDYSTTEQIEDLLNQYKNEIEGSLDSYTINGKKISSNPVINKQDVELNNVTNDAQVKRSEMGVAGGVATLDGTGKVPAAQLPVYVDDVLEGTLINATTFQLAEGQQGGVQLPNVIYVDITTNKSYRWSGTRYVTIASDLALGETSSTAYPGDKGKAATDNINKVKSTALSHIDDTTPVTYSASKVTVNYECYEGDQYGSTGTKHGADIAAASETAAGVMTAADKIQLNLIRQETLFHPIININQICPNQGQGDNKDRWLITYAIEAAWNWIRANPSRTIYFAPGLSIMFRSTNVRATNGFDGPWLVFTYTSTDFSENEFKKDSNWCRTLSEADLNYELADSQYDGFLSKIDWTRFNNATSTINSHVTNFQNPHNTNKSQVGLGNVDNTADIDKPVSTLQAQAIKTVQDNVDLHTQDKNNPHEVTKEQIGLNNVNNVKQIPYSEKGAINGVATLNQYGRIPINQIPYLWSTSFNVPDNDRGVWIRVATLNNSMANAIINITNALNIPSQPLTISVNMSYNINDINITQLGGNNKVFSAGRIVYQPSKVQSYLEIFYKYTIGNIIYINACNFLNGSVNSKFIEGSIPEGYNVKEFTFGIGNVANQLTSNTNIGNLTRSIFFENGIPKECLHTLEASVPTNAKFTDTTYDVVTTTTNGLMSSQDKVNLDTAIDDIEIIENNVNNIEQAKADKDELSNILGEEVINKPLLEEINTVTREEIKKDLFIDLWIKGYDCQYDGTKEKPFTCNTVELTYDEAIAVYNTPRFMQYNSGQFSLLNPEVKTIILGMDKSMGRIEDIRNTFRTPSLIVVRVCVDSGPGYIPYSPYTDISYAFFDCINLKKILGIIGFEHWTANITHNAFYNCKALEEVKIYHLRSDISFGSSPLLSFQSLDYIVTNAANSNAITITVHSDVYAKLTDETNIEWNTLLNTAAEKQITFAT